MKVGDLVTYNAFDGKDYLGLVLEYHGTWIKIFWSNVGFQVQDFSINDKEYWKVLNEDR